TPTSRVVGWSSPQMRSTARSAQHGPTPLSPTTPAECSPPAAPQCSATDPPGQRQDTGMEVFVASHAPAPRMLIFGAIDLAAALARQGAFLGYRVPVCDARPVFATTARPDSR